MSVKRRRASVTFLFDSSGDLEWVHVHRKTVVIDDIDPNIKAEKSEEDSVNADSIPELVKDKIESILIVIESKVFKL